MKENYLSAIINRDGRAECNIKNVNTIRENDDGAPVKTETEMSAKTIKGTSVTKKIIIDDEINQCEEIISSGNYEFVNCGLTGYRCAEMTVIAIEMIYKRKPKRVGFIGTGITNLMNCIAVSKRYNIDDVVIRGSNKNYAKNVGLFMTVCKNVSVDSSDDMRLMNECDVVVICTSNCNKSNLISSNVLKKPKLLVVLDCGYYLDESFRQDRTSYTDWKEQIEAHYDEEFIFDEKHYNLNQMTDNEKPCEHASVYLYGMAISDAVATEKLIERLESDGMEKPFLV